MTTNRRDFLKRSAAASAALSVPYIWTSSAPAQQDLNSKAKLCAIGVGGSRGAFSQGRAIAMNASRHAEMTAVCDVDDVHCAEFSARFGDKLNTYRDYRDLLEKEQPEVVTIGTPDHWHVPIAIAALESGAHVYCEKPLTLTIAEGFAIRKAVEDTGRVFQVGTQQRSQDALRFLKAIAMVQSGRLGDNVNAYVAIGGAPVSQPFETTDVPSDLDWDMWVGPAPSADYSPQRRREFRWFFEYSGGKMTDWGAHHIDIAQWALGFDHSGPTSVSGTGKFTPIVPDDFNWNGFLEGDVQLPSAFNTATEFSIDLKFASGATMNVNHHYKRDERTEFGNGILFEGDKGRIFVNRGRLTGAPIENLTEADHQDISERITKLYKGKKPGDHMRNFFECIADGSEPVSDVKTHHRTMTSCHLCNISIMLGRELTWDPEKEEIVGDDQAAALVSRSSREV